MTNLLFSLRCHKQFCAELQHIVEFIFWSPHTNVCLTLQGALSQFRISSFGRRYGFNWGLLVKPGAILVENNIEVCVKFVSVSKQLMTLDVPFL